MNKINSNQLELLDVILRESRGKWSRGQEPVLSVHTIKTKLLNRLRQRLNLNPQITWENYKKAILDEKVREIVKTADNSFDRNLANLSESCLINIDGETVSALIPWKELTENLLNRKKLAIHAAQKVIKSIFDGKPSDMIQVLEYIGLITEEVKHIRSNLAAIESFILDKVLTSIEDRDSLQIRYGIYNTIVRGSDLFSEFDLPNDPFSVKLEYGLRKLKREKLILLLDLHEDIRKWQFRSRIAEIVRLLSKLRQRFNRHKSYRDSPQLTRSVKFQVVRKEVPKRYIEVRTPLLKIQDDLKLSPSWGRYGDVWNKTVPRFLETMSERGFELLTDFQSRCFEKIFKHLVDFQSRRKGLVISAGTGTGKTLSFFGPLLLFSMLEKTTRDSKGVKAICIYPRIKLAENQLESFIRSLYEVNVNKGPKKKKLTIGIDYTGTPWRRTTFSNNPRNGMLYDENGMRRLWRYDESSDAYVCPYAKCPCGGDLVLPRKKDFSRYVPLECSSCDRKLDFIFYCKEDIIENPPDFFITTTESLHRRLFDSKFQGLFGTEKLAYPKLIMVDEIHLHTSLKGSQVASVLRRLLQRITLSAESSNQSYGEPIVLGLSATIAHPQEFFHELTGVPQHMIEVEGPAEDDNLEETGVEYFIFVKPEMGENVAVLSNLIQTCMCILHNMPQPEGFPHANYKALGFVDSLDLVQRWQTDLDDAERVRQLYTLRDPQRISTEKTLQNYFRVKTEDCKKCETMPNKNCILFREGECWWFMQYGSSQSDPLSVHFKTSARGYVPDYYDLVVTTSAMEVGYDDPDLMCIIQYQSPMNVASFTQRKGRGGRKLRDRPINVAVLSPYKTRDVYYYRNNHVLIEPFFEKLPLNPENKLIRSIHGFYAIMDYLAYERRNQLTPFPSWITNRNIPELEDVLMRRYRRKVTRYIRRVFNYQIENGEIEEIFQLLRKLKDTAKSISGYPWRILPGDLPANLFANINLPSVNVYEYRVYDGEEEWKKHWNCTLNPHYPDGFIKLLKEGRCPYSKKTLCPHDCRPYALEKNVDVNLALSEASLANVTFRWGDMAYWIPPYSFDSVSHGPLAQMDIQFNWLATSDTLEASIKRRLIPKTLLDIVPRIKVGKQKEMPLSRPDAIRETKFLDPKFGDTSYWIYCFGCNSVFPGLSQFEKYCEQPAKHLHYNVTQRTTSYPFTFYDARFPDRDYLTRGVFKKQDIPSEFIVGKVFGPFSPLFTGLFFANKDSEEYLKISKAIIGSSCHLKTNRGLTAERVFGYTLGDSDVALGFSMETDGLDFWLNKNELDLSWLRKDRPELFNTLKTNIFKFKVLAESKKPGGKNTFTVKNFLDAYLTFLARAEDMDQIYHYVKNGCRNPKPRKQFKQTVDNFYILNEKSRESVLELFEDADFMTMVIQNQKDILEENKKELLQNYLSDIFQHSLKHALKNAVTVLADFESERDVGGWTYLNFDFDIPQRNHIYVFEYGMYGTGALRGLYHEFRSNPQILWNMLEEYLTSCPTAQEERFLMEVLSIKKEKLNYLEKIIQKICESGSSKEKSAGVEELRRFFRSEYSYEIREEDVRSLVRVFSKPLEIEGTEIRNWRLYKELNIILYENLLSELGRESNSQEVQQAVFRNLYTKEERLSMPAWKAFFSILKRESGTELRLIENKIRSELKEFEALRRYIEGVTDLSELEKTYNQTEEEQLKTIAQKLGYDTEDASKRKAIKKVMETIFETINETPLYEVYFSLNKDQPYNPEKILASLSKRRLKEEVEKRLLNTCIDSCPSCLETPCEIDFILRSKMLLSRRLLERMMNKLKEKNSIYAENFETAFSLKEALLKRLREKYQTYLVYRLPQSDLASETISQLLGSVLEHNGEKYRVTINSSGYRKISFRPKEVAYEVGLRCSEVTT